MKPNKPPHSFMTDEASPEHSQDREIAALRDALADIINPLEHLRRWAEAQGRTLNGMAYSIANDLHYVQNIARKALRDTRHG